MGATGEGNLPTSRRRQCSTSPSEPERGNIGKARRWYTQAIDFGHPDSARKAQRALRALRALDQREEEHRRAQVAIRHGH